MPNDYEQSVGKLQDYISDDQMCMILSSSNSTTANKKILDCFIERMNCKEDLLDLCDQLEKIAISHQLSMLITELRSGEYYCVISNCKDNFSNDNDTRHHSSNHVINNMQINCIHYITTEK